MIIHPPIKDELCFSVNDYLFKLQETTHGLSKVEVLKNEKVPSFMPTRSSSALLQEAQKQITSYFQSNLKTFDLDLDLQSGTIFQQQVWQSLKEIPYAQVITYKELAQRVKSPRAYRAVGSANGANPLPIIIPCHRVVATQGLGGYAYGLEMKKELLELEGVEL